MLVTLFMGLVFASLGCRSSGVGLKTAPHSGGAILPESTLLPLFGEVPASGSGTVDPDGFAEFGYAPELSGGPAIPIEIDQSASRTTSNPNLPTSAVVASSDAASDEQLAVRENSLLSGGLVPVGTKVGGQHLAELPRNNPEAADLLDHWGYRRSQAITEGLSLTSPADGIDAGALETLQTAAQASSETPIAPNLQGGDEVQVLGTRRGVTYGRWAGGPADTLSIDFNLTGAGPLMTDDPAFRAMLERAEKAWSHRIVDTWAVWERPEGDLKGYLVKDVDPEIQIRVGAGGEISTGLEIDVRDANLPGSNAWSLQSSQLPGDSWEPRFGSIEVNREYIEQTYEARLFATLAHEIGHVLGAWTATSYFRERYADSYFDRAAGTWSGPNVVALHGGPAPFQDDSNPRAWVDGERDPLATDFDFKHSGVCASLMAYCRHSGALSPILPHAIDFAYLADLGMTITEGTDRPETYGLAGWTDYAAFTVSVSRQLQIALADPQAYFDHYDVNDPWQTLDVVDLLWTEVDAFGYLSTGDIAQSHTAEGPDGTVSYAGGLIGVALEHAGLPPVTGDASLAVDLATLDGTASFTSLKVYIDGTPDIFADGTLHYTFELSENAIVGTGTGSTFQADFYGPLHDDVAGVLLDPRAGLLASFGATLDERPTREDVIASADYLAGLTYQRNTPNPADEGWNQYLCRANSACEARDDGAGRWNPWSTTTRENTLTSTAGWAWRNAARPEVDSDFLRIERLTSASTNGARGRHVIDGFMGTLEHVAFGTGYERYTNWTTEPNLISPDFRNQWTGVQGIATGGLPNGHARWSGRMLGYHSSYDWGENPFVEGRATVDFSLSTNLVDVMFSEVASRDGKRVLPDFGFEDLRTAADGTFRGGAEGIIRGAFFGPAHKEAGGMFHHNEAQVLGSFGAWRKEATDPDTGPDATAPEHLASHTGPVGFTSISHVGTTPGGRHLADRPLNNSEADDLLDHWGHRRSRALLDGLSLMASPARSDTFDLHALQTAAQFRSKTQIAPNLHDGDEVRLLGTKRGVSYGRWVGGPADTLSIDFDLSGAGSLMVDDPAFRAMLERAGKVWSHRIVDTWATWERSPGDLKGYLALGNSDPYTHDKVLVGPEGEFSTGLEIDIRDQNLPEQSAGWATAGVNAPDDSWEPRFGSIEVDREHLQERAQTSILFSTLTHEIGHLLGAWTTYSYPEHLSSFIDETTGAWLGPNVVALHGGPAPFQDASDTHAWVSGERDPSATNFDFDHSGVCASLMAYCNDEDSLPASVPHAIDFAFLRDLGMTITEETERPETYGLAGWTDYAAFTVSVSRDLQIALADPQPHYGYHGGPWQTLDVVDLLQAEVDAFGYLSTGSFRSSYTAKRPEGTVRYSGGLLGAALDYTGLPPVTGDATLSIELTTLDGTASFTSLKVYPDGTPEPFASGSLHYPFELSENEVIGTKSDSTFRADFYGPQHEEVAGVLHDPRAGLLASFGATLDDRPSREDVIASADYLAGIALQIRSADPADDGWYHYRCGADSTCESRLSGFSVSTDWTTTTRESVLTATAGWNWRSSTRLLEDGDYMRIARLANASTDGTRGRHVIDGYAGTLNHVTFGVGLEESTEFWMGPNGAPPNLQYLWTGVQGVLSGSPPDEIAKWSGLMLGIQRRSVPPSESPLIKGLTTVELSLSDNEVDVMFSEIVSLDGLRELPDFGLEGLQLKEDGTIEGDRVSGAFFGSSQEEVAGIFEHDETKILGSFGATFDWSKPEIKIPEGFFIDIPISLTDPVEQGRSPGLLAAVIDEGGVQDIATAGVRKQGSPEKLMTNDLIHIGSNTKAMTSTMLATLVADGTFASGWSTTLADVFPELLGEIHDDYHSVDLSQLVRMKGGIARNAADWWAHRDNLDIIERRYTLLRENLRSPPAGPVGEFLYSNLAYMIAGAMAEKLTGKSWETLMKERLFTPLGMATAGFGAPGTPDTVEQPWGHRRDENGVWAPRQFDNASALGPAGTVHLSIEDWAKFIALWFPDNPPVILDRSTLNELITPDSGTYAAGWDVSRGRRGRKVLNHNGSNNYWFTHLNIYPNKGWAYVAATNSSDDDNTKTFLNSTIESLEEYSELSLRNSLRVMQTQAPLVDLGDTLHVGADVVPPADQLTAGVDYSGVSVSSGKVQDGVGADKILEYLKSHVSGGISGSGTVGLAAFPDQPIIRMTEGTSDEFAEYVVRAVQLINTALPYEKRILLSTDPSSPLMAIENVPDGQIFVDFTTSAEDWNTPTRNYPRDSVAIGWYQSNNKFNTTAQRWERKHMWAGRVWASREAIFNTAWIWDPVSREWEKKLLDNPVEETDTVRKFYSEENVVSRTARILIFLLGFLRPVDQDQFPDSIMRDRTLLISKHLPKIDSEALLAAYSRFEPGTSPEELSAENLGSWDDTSFHLQGNLDYEGGVVSFGVATRNGLAQPWASGPKPWSNLADNSALFGTVIWSGALLGVTPSAETVAGNARLAVELATLDGKLDFTNMEKWGVNEAPGTAGSGTTWGDGDLGYTIKVSENTFVQTGGNEGEVTGAFFGPAHEAMSGVLQRADLAAAFGGKR